MSEQNFSNHAKLVPAFHFFLIPVLLINLGIQIYRVIQDFKFGFVTPFFHLIGIFAVLLAAALLVMAFLARIFALGVQDRVIRLEERMRYERLLPEDLKPRIGEFTIAQLVSLRFASDSELPALARKVLDGKINDRKAIKQMVQNWRADYQRV
ncbi:MAG TPA: DUF6526 family protein [Candidatus Acidoferrum sp.]|jgi:uncharacterized membrane protein YciS (DUF1049 family)